MQTPLPDLLHSYNLPRGIFPKNATHYEFDEATGKLTVMLPWICECCFRDSSILRYAATVTATLQHGKLVDVEGIKTKVLIWVKVAAISVPTDHPGDKVYFSVGMKKSRPREVYEVLKDALEVEEF
ncbi:uncharacterized protein At5g01610 [Selaginella moellendorffii]|nr:uncharacterized protein At5g01610 [Selaginella moellendorffii]|eukprot:XP_024532115.1 uncharacterized protein At5g01610 [Selaginella moellendorffii]